MVEPSQLDKDNQVSIVKELLEGASFDMVN